MVSGLAGLLVPNTLLSMLGIGERSNALTTFVMASSEASLAMGLYYVMAAVLNVRAFILWSIPVRCLNFIVFTVMVMTGIAPARWMMVASLEGIGALVTGLSLLRTQDGRFDSFQGGTDRYCDRGFLGRGAGVCSVRDLRERVRVFGDLLHGVRSL